RRPAGKGRKSRLQALQGESDLLRARTHRRAFCPFRSLIGSNGLLMLLGVSRSILSRDRGLDEKTHRRDHAESEQASALPSGAVQLVSPISKGLRPATGSAVAHTAVFASDAIP